MIKLNINGLNVYLDNWFQGGMSHISFKEKSDLIYPNDPRYDPIMNARSAHIQAAAKARANNHFLDGPWTPCFREGTPVHTDGGPRNIEAVSVGTMVWSYDHERESWALMPVSHIEAHDFAGAMVTITVGNDTIAATLAHPFWVVSGECLESRPLARSRDGANRASSENGQWVSAGELRRGDTLFARWATNRGRVARYVRKKHARLQSAGRSQQQLHGRKGRLACKQHVTASVWKSCAIGQPGLWGPFVFGRATANSTGRQGRCRTKAPMARCARWSSARSLPLS